MINAIIFDFGDVFINLEKKKNKIAFAKLGLHSFNETIVTLNNQFELGKITEQQFLEGFQEQIPEASLSEIKAAWNTILGDFPLKRLEFLQNLKGKYRLFLLTNTDKIHIDHFEEQVGMSFFSDFYQCFDKVYYSYEIKLRKPDLNIYKHILNTQNLSAKRTLFVDDKKENTDAAAALGIQIWNLQVGLDDVTQLFEKALPKQ